MVLPFLPAIIGGIASVAGAGIAAGSASSAARASNRAQLKMNQKNLKWQKKFAKNAVQWRTRDAKKAGIHPLAAMGAQVPGFSPSFEAGDGPQIRAAGGAAAGQMISNAGQDIARATEAMSGTDAQLAALQVRSAQLQIRNQEMQNASLAADVALKTQAGTPPAYPVPGADYRIPGQGQTRTGPLIVDQPLQRTATNRTGMEPGAVVELGHLKAPDGRESPVMSQDAKNRLEEDLIGELQWNIRNRLLGPLMDNEAYRPADMPKGATYNPLTGTWSVPPVIKKKFSETGNMSDAFQY